MAVTEKPRVTFAAARLRAVHPGGDWAAFAHALTSLIPVETRDYPYAAVDRHWRCYWNPDAFAARRVGWAAAVLVHEVWHLLRRHPRRARALGVTWKTHFLWNLAADAEIHDRNPALVAAVHDAGLGVAPVTRESFDPPLADRGTAEVWYRDLLSRATTRLVRGVLCPVDGAGDVMDWGGAVPGAGAGGLPAGDEAPANTRGVSVAAAGVIERVTASRIRSTGRGLVPGGAERWADEVLGLVVDWRAALPGAVHGALASVLGTDRWSYARPGRRQSPDPRVLAPAWLAQHPDLAFVIDTSGSMSDRWEGVCKGEITSAVDALARNGRRPRVTVYACDAACAEAQEVFRGSEVRLLGGGGTDLRRAFERAAADRPGRPFDCVVVMTDGQTPWPAEPPPWPVVGLLFTDEDVPAWMEAPPSAVIRVPPEFATDPEE